jgi:hypothetical protein
MASFDFITDEEFRMSLERDFKEMNLCIQNGAYKAAVVLAGSIVEAVLIDYVIAEGILAREEALKLDFGKVLTLCKEKKIITDKTSDLSSVIKSYRNLIHPGRALRLNEAVDKDTAEVSRALVNIVLTEVEKQKKENYCYTAEQIIAKIKSDSNALAILSILIKKTNPKELERLMLKYLPEAYLEEIRLEDPWGGNEREYIKPALVTCFRQSFDNADDKLKKKIANWFAKIIREESDSIISSYGIAFLRSSDMKYMNNDDAEIVKQHIFGQMKNNLNLTLLETLSGIGSFLSEGDITTFIDPLVRYACKEGNDLGENFVVSLFTTEAIDGNFDSEIKKFIVARLDRWENNFLTKNQKNKAETVSRFKNAVEIPF